MCDLARAWRLQQSGVFVVSCRKDTGRRAVGEELQVALVRDRLQVRVLYCKLPTHRFD